MPPGCVRGRASTAGSAGGGVPHDGGRAGWPGDRVRVERADGVVVEAAAVTTAKRGERPCTAPYRRKYPERTCACGAKFRPSVYNQVRCDECVKDKHAKRVGGMRL